MNTVDDRQHIVFGAGLIGGFVAGGLLRAGYKVSVVTRVKTRDAFSAGLLLTDYLDNRSAVQAPGFIDTSTADQPLADVLWLTVKCTAVDDAIPEMAKLVNDETIIICCQNGIGSDAQLRERFPKNRILGAVVGYNVAEPEPGHLHRSTEGKLIVQNDERVASMIARLDCPLFPCGLSDDFEADQWAKLQLNLANPVGALADITVKVMLEQHGYRKIIAALQSELLMVVAAKEIELPKITALPPHWIPRMLRVPDLLFKLLGQKMLAIDPSARLSMWWDLHYGKATEIDFINQAVVDAAKQNGLQAPFNERIVKLIHRAEQGRVRTGMSAAQMWELLSRP